MKNKVKVFVIGGGASGMMAAIIAAKNGAEVTVFEQMNRVGKKLLATGNGRCNLTNINIDIRNFHGNNTKFAYGPLQAFDEQRTIEFFEELGIACKVEEGGKVYPHSDQASSVLDVLRYEMERVGVKEACDSQVTEIKKEKGKFILILKDGSKFNGDKVIITTGGKASPNLGSTGTGYNLVKGFGHKATLMFPSLVQLKIDASFLKGLKGVSFMGTASIAVADEIVRTEYGEILFTDYGVSGPPILQLSRKAGEGLSKHNKVYVMLDMFPNITKLELEKMLKKRIELQREKPFDFSFIGLLNKRLIPVILKEAKVSDLHKKCCEVTEAEVESIINLLKTWKLYVNGTQSFTNAQVTAGGIETSDIDNKTMESKLIKGLYFAGEVIDIDGDCGGFNLQFAWSTGYIAGINAAKLL